MAYDEVLREVMKVLWDRVVSKVVQKLGELKIPQGSRVWWCPTSCLTLLPFHAAGPSQGDDGGKYFLDYYTSSYTPTLSALLEAQSKPPFPSTSLLAVGVSKAPGQTPLPMAKEEIKRIVCLTKESWLTLMSLEGPRGS